MAKGAAWNDGIMSYTAAKPPSEEPYALIGHIRVRGGAARRLAALPGRLLGAPPASAGPRNISDAYCK